MTRRLPYSARRRSSLRRQLSLSLGILLVAAVVVIGLISSETQRQSLLSRLDEQISIGADITLRGLAQSDGALGRNGADTEPGAEAGLPTQAQDHGALNAGPGPQLGSLTVVIQDGQVSTAQFVTPDTGDTVQLDDQTIAQLQAALSDSHSAQTLDLAEMGEFRILAREDSESANLVISGQSTDQLRQTMREQLISFSAVAGLVLLVTLLAANWLIRRGLRPVERLATSTTALSATDMSSGEVSLRTQIPAASETAQNAEVAQLSHALEVMLGTIEDAFAQRSASEARLRQFIADASHELRTPLAAVAGYAQLAARHQDQVPAEFSHALSRISAESARMSSLVNDLLLLARLDAGTPLRQQPVDLPKVVVDALSDAHMLSAKHPMQLVLPEWAENTVIQGDADRLHQVFVNLFSNAIQHTPEGTEITVELRAAPGGGFCVDVADTGPGIPESVRQNLFDRFVRADTMRSRDTSSASTGLGLSIADAIMRAHHGRLDCQISGSGTTFTAWFPGPDAW